MSRCRAGRAGGRVGGHGRGFRELSGRRSGRDGRGRGRSDGRRRPGLTRNGRRLDRLTPDRTGSRGTSGCAGSHRRTRTGADDGGRDRQLCKTVSPNRLRGKGSGPQTGQSPRAAECCCTTTTGPRQPVDGQWQPAVLDVNAQRQSAHRIGSEPPLRGARSALWRSRFRNDRRLGRDRRPGLRVVHGLRRRRHRRAEFDGSAGRPVRDERRTGERADRHRRIVERRCLATPRGLCARRRCRWRGHAGSRRPDTHSGQHTRRSELTPGSGCGRSGR